MTNNEKKAENMDSGKKKKRSIFHRIVNYFLFFLLGIFLLLLIIVGITQTSAFRDYAREIVIEEVNKSINGKLYFESLEGTFFTSVIIRNASLTLDSDTLLKAGLIEVKTSPLQLLFKKIFVRKIGISDASINLIVEENGNLNLDRLVPPAPEDTATSEFPFKISVSELSLRNVSFSLQRYDLKGSREFYDSLFLDDFRIRDMNLTLAAFADIKNNDFEIDIESFSLNPNLNKFNIREISGLLKVNRDGLTADNLILKTKNSDITIDAGLTDINIFDSTSDLSHALVNMEIEADKFDFNDLRTFVPSVDIFNDKVFFSASASGSMKELEVSEIKIKYLETELTLTGNVKNLDEPENMYITAQLDGSEVLLQDINSLIPSLEFPPEYSKAGIIYLDTLHYIGGITNFRTHLFIRTDAGNVQASGTLDFSKEDMSYDLNFLTERLNLSPFTGIESDINSGGSIKGTGTDPSTMNAVIDIGAERSVINGIRISELDLKTDARNSVINYSLFVVRDTSEVQLAGLFDFNNKDNPAYEFKGYGKNINIADFTGDTSLASNLNFNTDAAGESFDMENINLYLTLNVFNSELNGNHIDSTRAIVDLRKDDSGERVINVISDLADISITGNYSLDKSISLINTEIELLEAIISEKLNDIIPVQDTVIKTTVKLAKKNALDLEEVITDSTTRIKYLVDLKNFELATLFLGQSQLEINGELFGDLSYTKDSIIVNFGVSLEYVKYRTPESVMFLSNLKLDFNLRNNLEAESFDDIYSSLSLRIDRVFAGNDIKDLDLNLKLADNSSYFRFSSSYNGNTTARLVGGFGFKANEVNLVLDTLNLRYNELVITNKQKIDIAYSDESINFRDFILSRNGSEISVKGHLSKAGNQDLVLVVKNLRVADVLQNALHTQAKDNLNAILNLNAHMTGNMANPVLDLQMAVDSVNYRGKIFGSLLTDIDYADRNIDLNIRFIEVNTEKEALSIKGNIPMDLSLAGDEKSDFVPGPMDVSLVADNFNLSAFGDLLPELNRLTGSFTADIKVRGTTEDIQPEGFLSFRDVTFLAEANNLIYSAGLRIDIDGNNIVIDTIMVQNGPDVPDGGTISGNGRAVLDGLEVKSGELSVGGRLKLLGESSRYSDAPAYGDLIIRTRGNIEFKTDEEGMYLNAPISVRRANLTIPPSPGAYSNTSRSFVYKFVEDTVDTAVGRMDFESLVAYNEQLSSKSTTVEKKSVFNYTLDLLVENEAKIVFVLSKEINQNLTAVLNGNVLYESKGGRTDIQGELKLLEGSTLEFIRTFRADGSIRFESDISNPYLNITATYEDYYYPSDTTEGLDEVLVAVKIKINGPLNELDKNFVKEENNIAVYYGEKSIEEDEPDPTKDASDAIMFIITGQFTEDLNQSQRTAATNQFSGAATSIAGSVIGGVLNQYLGEYVTGVELRRVGTETRFVFSGRAGNFRYQLGGSEDVFQNISQANLRIEYPVYKGLSLRFERREDVRERSVINEMINELGLRYRFEF